MTTVENAPIRFTVAALREIKRLMTTDENSDKKHLRIGVKGGGCSGLSYILGFEEKQDKDVVYSAEGLEFIIQPAHLIYLSNMEIDWQGGLNARGFTFTNPNASTSCGCGTSFAV